MINKKIIIILLNAQYCPRVDLFPFAVDSEIVFVPIISTIFVSANKSLIVMATKIFGWSLGYW